MRQLSYLIGFALAFSFSCVWDADFSGLPVRSRELGSLCVLPTKAWPISAAANCKQLVRRWNVMHSVLTLLASEISTWLLAFPEAMRFILTDTVG